MIFYLFLSSRNSMLLDIQIKIIHSECNEFTKIIVRYDKF